MTITRKIVLSTALVTMLTGCAAVEFAENNPYVASAAIQAGTVRFISEAETPLKRANNIVAVAELAQEQVSESEQTTLSSVSGLVRGFVDWDSLNQYETILLESLISSVEQRLQDDIGAGLLNDQDKVRVNQFMTWVIEAEELYKVRSNVSN
jgi:hypothetical protein